MNIVIMKSSLRVVSMGFFSLYLRDFCLDNSYSVL